MQQRLKENIERVLTNIAEAAQKSGRSATDIKLVAVSKTVSIDIIRLAYNEGLVDFGENRVQELTAKYPELAEANWHLIGHLQRNKVKYIVDKVKMIHSVDSVSLAEEISKRAIAFGKVIDILVQVNVSEEKTKFGIKLGELEQFLNDVGSLKGLKIRGLMTMAPFTFDMDRVRWVFRTLKEKFDEIKTMDIAGVKMDYLSMGMSNDYMVAIEEGANIVRIGSSIFGVR